MLLSDAMNFVDFYGFVNGLCAWFSRNVAVNVRQSEMVNNVVMPYSANHEGTTIRISGSEFCEIRNFQL